MSREKGKQVAVMRNITLKRVVTFLIGLVVLAFGITLNTKTGFGVSPIISVPYCISYITGFELGTMTFLFYLLYVFLQWAMLGKDFEKQQFLQIFVSMVTSFFIGLFNVIVPDAKGMTYRILFLILAIVLTGIGAAVTVGMRLIANPGDAIAYVVGLKLKKNFGFGKNVFDFTCLAASVIISLLAAGHLVGIGIGTVCSMIFIGRVVAVCGRPVSRLYDWTMNRKPAES